METFYVVKFKEQYDSDKGPKWRKDRWLVSAISPSDAQIKAEKLIIEYGNAYEIEGVVKQTITKVVE